jgi:hypothetical protein
MLRHYRRPDFFLISTELAKKKLFSALFVRTLRSQSLGGEFSGFSIAREPSPLRNEGEIHADSLATRALAIAVSRNIV